MVHKRKYLKTFTRAGKYTGLLHTKMQLKKMTKTGLIRLVIKLEKFIVSHAYEMYKAKLPRLRTTRQKAKGLTKGQLKFLEISSKRNPNVAPRYYPKLRDPNWTYGDPIQSKPKRKRKKLTGAAKAKFLARMNKGRRKKGLKPIRSR